MAAEPLRVLLIEDADLDAQLIARALERGGLGCMIQRVETETALRLTLGELQPDIVLSDFSLPHFDGMSALSVVREAAPATPFIFVSGTIGEEFAIRALREGATDYVLKSNLARLPASAERAVREARERAARLTSEREVHALRERIESIVSTLPYVVWSVAVPSRELLYVSSAIKTVFGRTRESFFTGGRLWGECIHADDLERVATEWDRALSGERIASEFRVVDGKGAIRWVRSRAQPVLDTLGKATRIDGITRDVTERHEQERKIAHLNRLYAVLSRINALIVRAATRHELYREACRIAVDVGQMHGAWLSVVDHEAKCLDPVAWHGLDESFVALLRQQPRAQGTPPEELAPLWTAVSDKRAVIVNDLDVDPHTPFSELHRRHGARALAALPLCVSERVEALIVLHASEPGFFDRAEINLLLELAGDLSFALDHMAKGEKLNYLAYYDPLTGLANRSLFNERLDLHLRGARRDHGKLAVLIVDIDRFKTINDSLGRHAGDALLKQVAQRCTGHFGDATLPARIGADRFALVMLDLMSEQEIARAIEAGLRDCFDAPFRIGAEELRISAKVGVAVAPRDGDDNETLFRNAEAALKSAKQSSERSLFYTQEMTARVAESLTLENKLRRAVDVKEFVLHYQPKLDLRTDRIVGAEALIRWRMSENELVLPAKFISLLEETGLILDVGEWVLRQAVQDHRSLRRGKADAPSISVNVSPIQLRRADFVDVVKRALDQVEDRSLIDLEITETGLLHDVEGASRKLRELRNAGMRVAIDDFGTGYSSLAYLAKLPVQSLKIDRSFVITMLADPDVMSVVSMIISLAHSLRLKVIAEGVDSEEQASVLRTLACDELQGFLFSPAVPLKQFEQMLSAPSTEHAVGAGNLS